MHRSYRRLTRADRYQMERFLARGKTKDWIALEMGFHRSTIYREFGRGKVVKSTTTNVTPLGAYSAYKADCDWKSKTYHRRDCLFRGYKIKGWVEDQIRIKLSMGWSPEQISERFSLEKNLSISHEAIYKFISSCQKKGETLHHYLRHFGRRKRRFKRRSRYWELQHQRRKSIEARPKEANQRTEAGHFERDLMLGLRGTGAVLTIVDRKTRYTLLSKVETTHAEVVNNATAAACVHSRAKIRTMTNDNGHEFGEFWKLEANMKAPVYFTHPLCPWERGTVENTIGLLRQYLPKRTDLRTIDEETLQACQDALNSRPRKSLGYLTPDEARTGKRRKLITQKRIENPKPEYYEKYYMNEEEIKTWRFS